MDNDILRLRNRLDELRAFRTPAVRPLGEAGFRAPGADAVPIALGEAWPSLESPATISFEARVPADWPAEVRLLLDVGGEALVRVNGVTIGGSNPNHLEYELRGVVAPGDPVRVEAEAVPYGPFGRAHHRPVLRAAALLHVDGDVDALWRDLDAAHQVAAAMVEARPELAQRLIDLLQEVVARVPIPRFPSGAYLAQLAPAFRTRATPDEGGLQDLWERWDFEARDLELDDAFAQGVHDAADLLRGRLADLREAYPPQGRLTMVGHTHIDLAWLWPLDETRRKVRRSFATVLHLMERDEGLTFAQASPQLYAYLEEDDPALFDEVRRRVREERWELLGGMWVEPDGNLPSGESWARQLLHGQRWYQQRFDRRAAVAWLPDTFGYAGNLPQLFRDAGLHAFFTTKLTWNETNRFPHDLYWWEGIDGTRILTHSFRNPGGGYNGTATADSLHATWENFRGKRHHDTSLYTFGYGDGGGGPTEGMLHRTDAYREFPGMPRTTHGSVGSFFRGVDGSRLPTWHGEQYLEFHRGTYTAQARVKSLNRRLEAALVEAEIAAVLARQLVRAPYPLEALHEAWTVLLRNQFHDILPGSSVNTVYREAEAELQQALDAACAIRSDVLAAASQAVGHPSGEAAIVVWNLGLHDRPLELRLELEHDAPVVSVTAEGIPVPCQRHGRTLVLAHDELTVPGIGYATVYLRSGEADAPPPRQPVRASDDVLENAWLRVEIGPDGTVHRLYDKEAGREVLTGRGNQVWAHPDVPANFDAWDVDASFAGEGEELTADAPPRLVRAGPVEAAIRVERSGHGSTVVQEYRLTASSRRLEVRTTIDWHARRTLLRARFPLAVRSHEAWYETAFGAVPRPTHRNTSWQAAQFEVPGHRWADLSEGDYGVSLLTTDKYGFAVHDGVMSVTLLTSSVHPDPWADEGRHETSYALYPHAGTWRAGTIRQAEAFNAPLHAVWAEPPASFGPSAGSSAESTADPDVESTADATRSSRATRTGGSAQPNLPAVARLLSVDTPSVALAALKASEEGDDVVMRVYEAHGTRGEARLRGLLQPVSLVPATLLEERIEGEGAQDAAFAYRPFQVRTFRMRLGAAAPVAATVDASVDAPTEAGSGRS